MWPVRAAAVLMLLCMASPAAAQYARLEGHGGPIKGTAIDQAAKRALTASFDYSVGYWDLTADPPSLIRWLEGHEAAANAVTFHPDGRRAVSAGDDFAVIVWDLDTGAVLHRMEGHQGKILDVEIGRDGQTVASAGWDGRIGLWNIETGNRTGWLEGHKANVNDVAFSTDGTTLWSASYDGTIREWPLDGSESAVLVSHGFGVNHLVVNEDAAWLAYGALDGAVRAIDLGTRAELADLTADRRPILALTLSPDGLIGVGDGQGYIMVIDSATWTIERDFHAAIEGPIWALDWVGNQERLIAGGLADEAAIWPVGANAGEAPALFADGERGFHRDPAEMSNGERQFVRKCSICHTLTPDGGRRAGPSLWGLFGRRAGSVEGYAYSDALSGSSIVWTDRTIHRLFEEGPDIFTPGSKMPMQRIAGADDRNDLISFLRDNTGPDVAQDQRAEDGEKQ